MKAEIQTVAGTAFYVKTITENRAGDWDATGLTTKNGFYVIHEGTKHHVYSLDVGKGECKQCGEILSNRFITRGRCGHCHAENEGDKQMYESAYGSD